MKKQHKLFEIEPTKKVQKEKIHILEFKENLNNKFGCDFFSLILPPSKSHQLENKFCIKLRSQVYCNAYIVSKEKLTFNDILERKLYLLDFGKNYSEYIEYIKNLYSKKIWWKQLKTEFNYLIFKKEIQLELFK